MNGPSQLKVRVYYEDTDASGVVYHARYLHWLERGRTEWLRQLGLEQHRLREQFGVVFTVARLEIEYGKPARLDQELIVNTTVGERRRASLVFAQDIVDADGGRLTRASVTVACVDATRFRPARLPDPFVAVISE
ncbi:MAG: tol-pal system-associated acyl-CoA thioesterase [Nevskiales bacterium]|nr:tol-pal system-associated acyl-CoA thioesterase [Nevskiales bacterium]